MTDVFTADPDAFVYGDRLYVDTDRDEAPLGAGDFLMREWRMYSTTKTANWTHHGALMTLADFRGPIATRGRPRWSSATGTSTGTRRSKWASNSMSIGVAVGDSPLGPFHDALGGPLIDNTTRTTTRSTSTRPCSSTTTGRRTSTAGSFSSPRAAKLKPNMVELEDLSPGGAALGPRAEGRIGKAPRLNGSSEYVTVPAGVVSGSRV